MIWDSAFLRTDFSGRRFLLVLTMAGAPMNVPDCRDMDKAKNKNPSNR